MYVMRTYLHLISNTYMLDILNTCPAIHPLTFVQHAQVGVDVNVFTKEFLWKS